jgi:hypothetical protein
VLEPFRHPLARDTLGDELGPRSSLCPRSYDAFDRSRCSPDTASSGLIVDIAVNAPGFVLDRVEPRLDRLLAGLGFDRGFRFRPTIAGGVGNRIHRLALETSKCSSELAHKRRLPTASIAKALVRCEVQSSRNPEDANVDPRQIAMRETAPSALVGPVTNRLTYENAIRRERTFAIHERTNATHQAVAWVSRRRGNRAISYRPLASGCDRVMVGPSARRRRSHKRARGGCRTNPITAIDTSTCGISTRTHFDILRCRDTESDSCDSLRAGNTLSRPGSSVSSRSSSAA